MKFATEAGGEFSTEKIGDVEVTVVRDADDENRVFGVFEREKTIVVATDPNVLRGVLHHWDGAGEGAAATEAATAEVESNREDASGDDAEDESTEDELLMMRVRRMTRKKRCLFLVAHSPRTLTSRRSCSNAAGLRTRRRT